MKTFEQNCLILFFVCWISSSLWGQEILIPSSVNVKDEVLFTDSNHAVIGNGFFPISYSDANYILPVKDSTRSWIVRKLFTEHLIQKSGKDYFLAIDPLLNTSIGKERLQNTPDYLYQNTRGVQAFAHLRNKLSFYTAFYENQARFVDYQSAYFEDRGEYYPNSGTYTQSNAVVPNGGRTKPFKTNGFDYASAVSYVRLTPLKQLSVQFGNAPRFFGWGHRSMLLSDNSFNYTHLSVDWEIAKGLSYTFIRGKQLNLIRKVHSDMVESPYERKGIGVHYLSYRPAPSLVIGLFESTIYLRDEATSSQRVNPYFYQPVLGLNTMVVGGENADMKNILGLNIGWRFHPHHMIYAQAVSDDFSSLEYGFQLGYRTGNTFNIKSLRFQIEYNQASTYLYAANNHRMAFTHFNLPLAHTLGNGFQEVLIRMGYRWKGLFIEASAVYYESIQPMSGKTNLYHSKQVAFSENYTQVLNTNIELGYEVNSATKLRLFVAADYRASNSSLGESVNYGVLSFGLRSALTNQYFDF
ncbi:MAG TPA: hypothetical protein VKY37_01940 [Brumimicrobium sp.]|nr:hypothetical protein [Brumimicrobium sp.]